MPELPEVHTISADLNKNVRGFVITHIKIAPGYNVKPNNETFVQNVVGKKIDSVTRIAKNIIIKLEDEAHIVGHLAMTGRLLLRPPEYKQDKWVRVLFRLKKSDKIWHFKFTDMRMFGKLELRNEAGIKNLEEKYGPEPVDKALTPEKFLEQIQSKRTNIKNALLDQKIIAGLGNIYATDALFMAKIHPETKTSDITLKMAGKLLEAARTILLEGIKNRGSTLPDKMYVDIFGKPGTQQNHFRIYMQGKCPKCGTKVAFKKINGRGTYFCPECQCK
ncbi:bifunctional DNA-formamidopyrimidine glycosylase/DNA-(apurinic or apyrimidinic site) lyase [bacterium]|nr:bifunctional DNA-formamidopyrimidine glycosylase/DNA-(apurinic or apyrimidinic site) lyase [bacterium]